MDFGDSNTRTRIADVGSGIVGSLAGEHIAGGICAGCGTCFDCGDGVGSRRGSGAGAVNCDCRGCGIRGEIAAVCQGGGIIGAVVEGGDRKYAPRSRGWSRRGVLVAEGR